jgi:hypothetical protein
MPKPFTDWTQADVDAHNARVGKKFTAEAQRRREGNGEAGPLEDTETTQTSIAPKGVPCSAPLRLCGETDLREQKTTDEQKLNKLERDWLRELRLTHPSVGIQDITLKMADDVRYTPDFNVVDANGQLVFYETKGKRFWDDAKVKLRVAARQWRCFRFVLVTRDNGQWLETPVPP